MSFGKLLPIMRINLREIRLEAIVLPRVRDNKGPALRQ